MKALINPKAVGICLGLVLLVFAFSGTTLAGAKAEKETAWLGVQLQALNEDLKEAMDMDDDIEGVLIAEVLEDSPAEEAGLEDGDVVTAVDGEEMESVNELVEAIRDRSPGDDVKIDILRDGRRRTFYAQLGESEMQYKIQKMTIPDMSHIGEGVHKWVQAWGEDQGYLGVHIMDFNDDLGQYFKVKEGEGVLITEVAEDSPAEDAGLVAGDVVLEYDGKLVKNTSKFRKYVAGTEPGEEVSLVVKRKGRKKTFEVEIGEMESPMSHFMETFRMPSGKKTCGRVMIKDEDGEVEIYGLPGGAGHFCTPHMCTPGSGKHRIVIEGLDDLEELHLEDLEELEDLEDTIRDLKKEMKELRKEVEELKE
jgi:C-terminal processing protease CtpA/Prc